MRWISGGLKKDAQFSHRSSGIRVFANQGFSEVLLPTITFKILKYGLYKSSLG